MGKKSKIGKARKDRFYFLAKETGFRSRAAFKLIQLNRRFGFLNSSKVLIDLCAAPGGWLQVSSKEMPISSLILGVDLVPIQPIPRVKTFVADITTERCKQLIRSELMQNKADVVLHDGAPNVGTAWSIDEYGQAHLCLQAFALATDFLRKGGWFITKVFRSRDYEPLKWVLSQFFHTLRAVKPEASRMESAEIFLVGQSYRAPDRIDKRFLDPRHVFGEVEQVKNRAEVVSSLLKECKRKRKAEGYAEGDSLYRELRVSDFLHANDPLETLAKTNKIVFDLDEVKCHPLTTDAIKADMEDIQVLGKGEIRQLLKWRKKILEALEDDSSHQVDSTNLEENCAPQRAQEEDADEDKDDVEIEEEVQRLLHEEAKHHKKRLKRVRKAKMKLAERLVLKMEHPGDRIEEVDEELFSLSTVHDLVGLEKAKKLFGDTSQTGVDALVRKENTLALKELRSKYENEQRSAIEGSKRVHFERRGDDVDPPEYADDDISAKKDTRDDLYLSSNEEDDDEDDGLFRDVDLDHDRMAKPSQTRVKFSDSTDSLRKEKLSQPHPKKTPRVEAGQNAQPIAKKTTLPLLPAFTKLTQRRNPLLMDLDDTAETLKRKRKIQSWLESDEMKDLLEPVTLGDSSKESSESDSDDKLDSLRKKKKKRKRVESSQAEKNAQPPSTEPSPGDSHPTTCDPCGPESPQPPTQQLKRLRRPLTPEEKALALRLIRSAKSRRELIESNYHRMQFFEDPSELPDWFVDDERKHMRKPLPITKEELAIVRPTMGRSIKKVEEAKRRKKARMDKRLKRIRQKAEDIPDDVPEAEKWQQIKQMYQKANLLKKKRRPLHLIVNTKAGARNPAARPPKGAKVKIVDRRMKSDLRALQRGSGKGRRGTNNNKGRRKKPVQLLAHKPRRGGRVKRHRASGH